MPDPREEALQVPQLRRSQGMFGDDLEEVVGLVEQDQPVVLGESPLILPCDLPLSARAGDPHSVLGPGVANGAVTKWMESGSVIATKALTCMKKAMPGAGGSSQVIQTKRSQTTRMPPVTSCAGRMR